jgi:ribosomal protein S8
MKDFVGDMLTRITNGHQARLGAILLHPSTPKLCIEILDLLCKEGYIRGFQE